MNLEDLKKEMPFKWRVQSTNQWGASCVAYIDARDVQDVLDKVCGQDGWQARYSEHKGNLFCSIGIFSDDFAEAEWVWKEDCGTESNVEKQKGEASDAFKRAGVMWGIGRFLYSKKIVKIPVEKDNNGKYQPFENGKRVYDITEYCNRVGNKTKKVTPTIEKPKKLPKFTQEGATFHLAKKTPLTKLIELFDLDQAQMKKYSLKLNA